MDDGNTERKKQKKNKKQKHTLKGLILTEKEAKSGHYITFYHIHSAQLAET